MISNERDHLHCTIILREDLYDVVYRSKDLTTDQNVEQYQ